MHPAQPRLARVPRRTGRQGQGVSDLVMVNEGRTAGCSADVGQSGKTLLLEPDTFRLEVAEAERWRRPTIEAEGSHALRGGLEKDLIGGHVVCAVGFAVRQQATAGHSEMENGEWRMENGERE